MFNIHFAAGLALAFGLLAALGPKDMYVIEHSMRRGHAVSLIAICSLSDALLILAGVWGLGAALTQHPALLATTLAASALYLMYFACKATYGALTGANLIAPTAAAAPERRQVVKGALFHSLLTPFAWLDTVFVIGTVSATQAEGSKLPFTVGAMCASFLWFGALTATSRAAAGILANTKVWRALSAFVALSMLLVAGKLSVDFLQLPVVQGLRT